MSTLSKDQILAARPATATVTIPRLGGEVEIRSVSRGTRKKWVQAIRSADPDALEIVIVESLVEPKLTLADVKELNELDERVINELYEAIEDFNGWNVRGDDEQVRRDILTKVADGDLSVEEALSTFRS